MISTPKQTSASSFFSLLKIKKLKVKWRVDPERSQKLLLPRLFPNEIMLYWKKKILKCHMTNISITICFHYKLTSSVVFDAIIAPLWLGAVSQRINCITNWQFVPLLPQELLAVKLCTDMLREETRFSRHEHKFIFTRLIHSIHIAWRAHICGYNV